MPVPPSLPRLTLLSHLLVFPDGDVPAPGLLDHAGKAVEFPLPHLFEEEELGGGTRGAEPGQGPPCCITSPTRGHPKPSIAQSDAQLRAAPPSPGMLGCGVSRGTYRFGVLDKHLAPTHLVLVRVHVDGAQQVLHPLPLIPAPGRPRLGGEDGIAAGTRGCESRPGCGDPPPPPPRHPTGRSPLQEFMEDAAVGETCPAHPDVLLQPQVLDLVLHPAEP